MSSSRKNQIRLELKLLEKANFDIGQVQLGRITESQKTDWDGKWHRWIWFENIAFVILRLVSASPLTLTEASDGTHGMTNLPISCCCIFLSRLFHKYGWVLVWKPIYSLLLCFYRHIKYKIILLNPNCLNCDFHLSGITCTGKKPKQLFWGYLLLDYVFDINWPLLCIGIVRGFLFLEQSAKFQVRRAKIVQNCQIEHYQWFITEV